MKLIIDSREKEEARTIIQQIVQEHGYQVNIEQLSVGDLAITDDKGNIKLVLERKTCRDMAASLNDGRYREQKDRLLASEIKWKGYILEGQYPNDGIRFPSKKGQKVVTQATYYSMITGITLRDKLLVYNSNDVTETSRLLCQMLKKIPDYVTGNETNYQSNLIKSVSTVKKDNMTPEVCYLAQLCQIPGVSHTIATVIATKYLNMQMMYQAKAVELSELLINNRRLGKVLGNRIYDYLHWLPETKSKPKITLKR